MVRDEDNEIGPQDADLLDDAGTLDERSCPACGRPFVDELDACPHCGQWVDETSEAERRSQGWFWPIVIAFLVGIILLFWSRG